MATPMQKCAFPLLLLLLLFALSPIHADDDEQQQEEANGLENEQNDAQTVPEEQDQSMSIATLIDTLPEKSRQDLQDILDSRDNTTKYDLDQRLDAWANNQSANFSTVYFVLKKAYEEAMIELDARHTALMQNENDTRVIEADRKIRAISNNQFITPAQEQAQIFEVLSALPEDVRNKVMALAPYPVSDK